MLFLDETDNKVLTSWAPRPKILQALLVEWKKESSDMVVIAEKLHGWYAKDKTVETQKEFAEVVEGLNINLNSKSAIFICPSNSAIFGNCVK